jgi:cell division protein FtsL
MAALDEAPRGRSERIDLAVQREMARRRRLLRLYLLLLLVPIGIAVWLLTGGGLHRTTEIPGLPKSVQEALPKIEKQQVQIEEQKRQVQELTQGQKELATRVTAVDSSLQQLEPKLVGPSPVHDPAPEIRAVHRGLDVRLDTLEERLKRIEETQAGLVDQQKKIVADLEQLQRVRPDFREIEKKPPLDLKPPR